MKRCILSITFLLLCVSGFAQKSVYLGTAGRAGDYIYEDGALDDGTRYIMSDLFYAGPYKISLCKYIPLEGDSWYGLAVESGEFIPNNGLMAFFFKDKDHAPLVIGQVESDNTVSFRRSVGLKPFFLLGGGHGNLFLATQEKIKEKEIYFGLYVLSEEELLTLIKNVIRKVRISSRSRYYEFNRIASENFPSKLASAKGDVDARAALSRNAILEGVDK